MKCTFLGTGTSHGIPVIACPCECCTSTDAKDTRFRSSLWVTESRKDDREPFSFVIDTGPDFRSQALKYKIKNLHALLLTHSHADHLNGLDDIRIFSYTKSYEPGAKEGQKIVHGETSEKGLPVYGDELTLSDLRTRFSYIFNTTQLGGGKPKISLELCTSFTKDAPLILGTMAVVPVPMIHGSQPTVGWLIFKDWDEKTKTFGEGIAYLTDCSKIPDTSMDILLSVKDRLRHVVIDGLRPRPHTTHFSMKEAFEIGVKIGAPYTWITHICHDLTHVQIQSYLDSLKKEYKVPSEYRFSPAYDGLTLEL